MIDLVAMGFPLCWLPGVPPPCRFLVVHDHTFAGRNCIGPVSVDSIASLALGATVSAMWMVLEGHQTWREAGTSTAELVLRAMGIEPAEAREISMAELPRLAT